MRATLHILHNHSDHWGFKPCLVGLLPSSHTVVGLFPPSLNALNTPRFPLKRQNGLDNNECWNFIRLCIQVFNVPICIKMRQVLHNTFKTLSRKCIFVWQDVMVPCTDRINNPLHVRPEPFHSGYVKFATDKSRPGINDTVCGHYV